MPKVPRCPDAAHLAALKPKLTELQAGTTVYRVYFRGGDHPTLWNQFRRFGPSEARFDHHDPSGDQNNAVVYLADSPTTCFAEVFQQLRVIDRALSRPWLVGFELDASLSLLDLTGRFTTRMGASAALMGAPRSVGRNWARGLYAAYPGIHGMLYPSSMDGCGKAIVLNERAMAEGVFPDMPSLHRALDDRSLDTMINNAGRLLGYAVRSIECRTHTNS